MHVWSEAAARAGWAQVNLQLLDLYWLDLGKVSNFAVNETRLVKRGEES